MPKQDRPPAVPPQDAARAEIAARRARRRNPSDADQLHRLDFEAALSDAAQRRMEDFREAARTLTAAGADYAAARRNYEKAWRSLARQPALRDHPAVTKGAAARRLLDPAAFRALKNVPIGDLKGEPEPHRDFVSGWVAEHAAPLLRPCDFAGALDPEPPPGSAVGPEQVRVKLRTMAKEIGLPEIRNPILRALSTRQGFHKRLGALGLIPRCGAS
jgi:hypothetical protein